ncbi:MAG: hypothetical protein U9R21_04110 [Candidatus Thermoplasmatota archaeon]|nr:hypothetical protein [Candidatus Thermoplasmatota archaeon]
MEKFICPKCGKKTMVKQKVGQKKRSFVCTACGFQQGLLPKDRKRDVG